MAMLLINGAEMPAPSALKVTLFDVSSPQERSAAGGIVMDRVAVKRRLELSWAFLSGSDLARLLNAVTEAAFFEADYPDPAAGEMRGMTCCCGDRATGILRMEGGEPIWTNVEMTFTEK
ncbi:MAG: hypothetical protein IJ466_12605 [Clostridia bacterium]|nr:hypothetical protein [Clostridia bacterium]